MRVWKGLAHDISPTSYELCSSLHGDYVFGHEPTRKVQEVCFTGTTPNLTVRS